VQLSIIRTSGHAYQHTGDCPAERPGLRIRESDSFGAALGVGQEATLLHKEIIQKLLDEVGQWDDDASRAVDRATG
jgi:hypothetical protein